MNIRRLLQAVVITLSFTLLSSLPVMSQDKSGNEEGTSDATFSVGNYVYVEMPDGKEVIAIIKGKISKNKFYIRKYKSDARGKVNVKYMRPMPKEKEAALKSGGK